MKKLLAIFLLLTSFSVFAALDSTPPSKIKRLITYNSSATFVQLETNGSVCTYGFFIEENDPGFQRIFSMLIAAYHADTAIKIVGHDDNRWSGSSNPVCKIRHIEYNRVK